MGLVKRAGNFANRNKTALGLGAVGLGAATYGAVKLGKRFLRGRKKRSSSVARLRARVQKLSFKIKEKQLKRKLFKEEIRGI